MSVALLYPPSTEAVGTWDAGHYAGSPAVTVNQFGAGRAIYVGTYLSAANAAALLGLGVAAAGVEPILPDLPGDVEAVRRSGPDRTLLFLLNHGHEPRTVAALPPGRARRRPQAHGRRRRQLRPHGRVRLGPHGAGRGTIRLRLLRPADRPPRRRRRRDHPLHAHRRLWGAKVAVGVVEATDSFAGLKLLVGPSFTIMDEDLTGRLAGFVRAGGTLLATAWTGTRDRANRITDRTPPGLLAGLLGATVEEFARLDEGENSIRLAGGAAQGHKWSRISRMKTTVHV